MSEGTLWKMVQGAPTFKTVTMLMLRFLFQVFICNDQFTGKDSGDRFVTNDPQTSCFLSSGFPLN